MTNTEEMNEPVRVEILARDLQSHEEVRAVLEDFNKKWAPIVVEDMGHEGEDFADWPFRHRVFVDRDNGLDLLQEVSEQVAATAFNMA